MAAVHVNFMSGQITNDPLTAGASTVDSAGFAALPEIVSPDYMWLSINPEADGGVPPEVVRVIAHAPSGTSITVVRAQQNTVAQEFPQDTVWVHAWTTADVQDAAASPGDIKASILDSDPGWLKLDGTSIASAASVYPDLWAVAPLAWKSAGTLNLPNMSGACLRADSGTNVGSFSGSNEIVLGEANLPPHSHSNTHQHTAATSSTAGGHSHTMTHDHANATSSSAGGHSHTVQNHTHTINHNHPSATTSGSGGHNHAIPIRGGASGFGTSDVARASNSGSTGTDQTTAVGNHTHTVDLPNFTGSSGGATPGTSSSGAHTHTVNIPAFTGSTGPVSAHSHNVSIPEFVGSTGSTGSGAALPHTPLAMIVNYFIKF